MFDRHICQVALCGHNAARLREWYREVFGLARGGGALLAAPPMPTRRIQGIHPNPVETVTWLVDRQDYFQLEFFQFHRPKSALRPVDWRPCDIGYNLVGLVARDFDQLLHRFAARSDRPAPVPVGDIGDRRACLQDPEGNWIEVRERDPLGAIEGAEPGVVRPELLSAARFMRVSVPDLERARSTFSGALGMTELPGFTLHTAGDEALWGLPGARAESAVLRGRNFLVELVQYRDPAPRPRPAGYQISDQGFMNIALGYRSPQEFDAAFRQAAEGGMRPNGEPVDTGLFRVMYVNDLDGFSIEMLYARSALWRLTGFSPGEPYVGREVLINAPPEAVWERLIDHANLGAWSPFRGKVLRPGHESPDGPGCLRELRAFGLRLTEEVVDWDEGRRYTYRLRTGAPFRWHQGDLILTAEKGATRVRWAIRFEAWLPLTGRVTAWALGILVGNSLAGLKRQLERRSLPVKGSPG